MSLPFSSVMTFGGLYVLGGGRIFTQAAGPLFRCLAGAGSAGRGWFRWSGPVRVRGDGEEGVREHRQGDMPVPGWVEPDLVVIEAGLVFGLSETVLDGPAGAGDGHQLGQGRAARR